jgi:hypothetical protein
MSPLRLLQNSNRNIRECYCGQTLSPSSAEVDDAKCNEPCAGDAHTYCGGNGFLQLYALVSGDGLDQARKSLPPKNDDNQEHDSAADPPDTDNAGTTHAAAIVLGTVLGAAAVVALATAAAGALRRRATATAAPTSPLATEKGRDAIAALDAVIVNDAAEQSPVHHRRASGALPAFPEPRDAVSSGVQPFAFRGSVRTDEASTPGSVVLGVGDVGRLKSPDKLAQPAGLGERAWNRRRLSVPFPPAEAAEAGGSGGRMSWTSQPGNGAIGDESGGGRSRRGDVGVRENMPLPASLGLIHLEDVEGPFIPLSPMWTVHTVESGSSTLSDKDGRLSSAEMLALAGLEGDLAAEEDRAARRRVSEEGRSGGSGENDKDVKIVQEEGRQGEQCEEKIGEREMPAGEHGDNKGFPGVAR